MSSSEMHGARKALEGVRVLDLTHQVAGPSSTMALAMLGAEVIKVERPGSDESQRFPFFLVNVSKRSVSVDLKSEKGVEAVLNLAEQCDIFVENFRPGVIERLGLGYDVVSARNERLIYAQLRGFAADSEFASYTCYDPIAQAMGGAFSITGEVDGRPLQPGPDLADSGTGMIMAITLLAALYQREHTGLGQRIELAMSDHIATFNRLHYAWPIERGVTTPRSGNAVPFVRRVAPGDTYPTPPFGPDDYVYIYAGTNGQWTDLLKGIDRLDLADDPRLQTPEERGQHHEELDQILTVWCSTRHKLEVMRLLGPAGVPCAAVRGVKEVYEDQEMRDRGIFQEIVHPELGPIYAPSWPAKLSGTDVIVKPPSQPGADNDSILGDLLGMSAEEIAEAAGVAQAKS
ncbi:MAG TPA: CoA transferase [Solirubrobacteraceae bacterium]|jgi:formyl-CoA transferase|nr:CoA transferase [Solirubrobacteraceae bacterium]